jgi:4'-phosphopantetheinyl transferase
MQNETLQLWFAYPDDLLSDEAAKACLRLLSDDERVRLDAFRFDRGRREYLATRALVRTALAANGPFPAETWRFKTSAHGKPAIDQECGLRFNLSNCPGLVVCLIAQGVEVGVDAEPFERAGEVAKIASEVLSPRELGQLELLDDQERLTRGLALWTLKESYIKAHGLGLSLPLDKFSFLFGGAEGISLEMDSDFDDQPERWRFCLLKHVDHQIALVAELAADPALELWEARPMAAPARLAEVRESWFPQDAS